MMHERKQKFECTCVIDAARGLSREVIEREIKTVFAEKGLAIDEWREFEIDGEPALGAITYG